MLKFSGLVIWRLGSRTTIRNYSAPGVTVFKADKADSVRNISDKSVEAAEIGAKEGSSK